MSTIKKKAKIPATLKSACWDKHIGAMIGTAKCVCCGVYDIRMDKFHCGHVIAEAKGGILAIENLRPICDRCNSGMGTENLYDFKRRCNFVPPSSNETHVNESTKSWKELYFMTKENDNKEKEILEELLELRKEKQDKKEKEEEHKRKYELYKKETENQYMLFKQERIIDMRDSMIQGFEEMGNEQATLKDVHVAYSAWLREKVNEGVLRGKKFSKQEMQNRLDEDFGSLDNGVYKRVMVFFDDEGRAEFLTERAKK